MEPSSLSDIRIYEDHPPKRNYQPDRDEENYKNGWYFYIRNNANVFVREFSC